MREVWDSKLEVAGKLFGLGFRCLHWKHQFFGFDVCFGLQFYLFSTWFSVFAKNKSGFSEISRLIVITFFWFLIDRTSPFEQRISLETINFFYTNGFPVLEIHQYFFRCLFLWLTSVKRHKWIYGFSVTGGPPTKKFHTYDLHHCRWQIV